MYKRFVLVFMVLSLCSGRMMSAATIHVPADQPTIEEGIDAANPGDTVLVACGTYYEHDLTLTPGVSLVGATGEYECVEIVAEGMGRVMRCPATSPETLASTVAGITFSHGVALGTPTPANLGGGVYCDSLALVRFVHCAFTDNSSGQGGGLYVGAEMECVEVSGCKFARNSAVDGGGLYVGQCTWIVIDSSEFSENHANFWGGGVYVHWCATFLLANSVILDNRAGFYGGGVFLTEQTCPEFSHCTFFDNHARAGGGILCSPDVWGLSILHTIIAFNDSCDAVFSLENTDVGASCCNFYGNFINWSGELADDSGLAGNISADPLFCDTAANDFTLRENSPSAAAHSYCGVNMGAFPVECSCCAIRGDIDYNWAGPNIADLVYLVGYMFLDEQPPPCLDAADIDGNGTGPDITDLVCLVTYMFGGGPAPAPCN